MVSLNMKGMLQGNSLVMLALPKNWLALGEKVFPQSLWPEIAKFRLKLKKAGKTTRPFRYDLNQIR